MPRDVFWTAPDGRILMQAYVSFPGRDESSIPPEELNRTLTWEQVRAHDQAFFEAMKRAGRERGESDPLSASERSAHGPSYSPPVEKAVEKLSVWDRVVEVAQVTFGIFYLLLNVAWFLVAFTVTIVAPFVGLAWLLFWS